MGRRDHMGTEDWEVQVIQCKTVYKDILYNVEYSQYFIIIANGV